jgi:hypothetical protein
VGLLTRNVVFMGVGVNDATPNYGAHIVVGNIVRPSAQFIGSVNISYAQLHNCGQMGMEHSALAFTYTSTMPAAQAPVNTVNGSSFSYSFNYAVVGTMARGLVLRDNVFHRTYRTSVDLDELVRVMRACVCGEGGGCSAVSFAWRCVWAVAWGYCFVVTAACVVVELFALLSSSSPRRTFRVCWLLVQLS